MKRTILLIIMVVFFTGSMAWSRTITVKISNIRGDNGMILVMARSEKESKPVYGMTKPVKGEATVTLENVKWEQFDLSVFHDENGNYKMDFTDDHKPAEGYAMKNCKTQKEEDTVKLKLYYPSSE